jgi:O-antigen/teichoic acid export membrane protein
MSHGFWSAVLQWSRLGVNAAVFLIAARFLTLAEIGAFATAFAPIRLAQVVHKTGVADAAVLVSRTSRDGLFGISFILGLVFAAGFAVLGLFWGGSVGPMMIVLAVLPLMFGFSAVSEGVLRQGMRIRALALRTLAAQVIAGVVALGALAAGQGAISLVVFALVNAAITAGLSWSMADWRPRWRSVWRTSPAEMRVPAVTVARIALRDLAGNATLPFVQLAVALVWGLPAAGAFQIATRVLSLLDALALSPIRYLALPQFAVLPSGAIGAAVLESLRTTTRIAAWLYPGAMLAAPEILTLIVGPSHAGEAAAPMAMLCLFGLAAALAMPLTQGLTARGQARLTLLRAVWTMAISLCLSLLALGHSMVAATAALPAGAILAWMAYCAAAASPLGLTWQQVLRAVAPAVFAGSVMVTVLVVVIPDFDGAAVWLSLAAKICLGSLVYGVILAIVSGCLRRAVLA